MTQIILPKTLVLPLHPKWAAMVTTGKKTIEVRRRFTKTGTMPILGLVYTTTPIKAITTLVTLTTQTTRTIAQIDALQAKTHIPSTMLDTYLDTHGLAIALQDPKPLTQAIPLNTLRTQYQFTPPQNFCYPTPTLVADVLNALTSPITAPVNLANLPATHPLFKTARSLYKGFDTWLERNKTRRAWGYFDKTTLVGLAIMADKPAGTKLCTFTTQRGYGAQFHRDLMARETTPLYAELPPIKGIQSFFLSKGWTQTATDKPDTMRVVYQPPPFLQEKKNPPV